VYTPRHASLVGYALAWWGVRWRLRILAGCPQSATTSEGNPQAGFDRYPRRLDAYTISCMGSRLAALAATQDGVILRRQALDYGFTDQEIASLCRGGVWVRIRRGAFVDGPLWRAMTLEDRHRVTVHAVVLSLDKPAVVSHTSASVLLNLPTWGYDLSHIHVTRADLHSARIEGGVHHHAGSLETGDVISVGGVEVTSLDRTAIQIALMGGFERGVVVADAALRLLGGDQAVLLHRLDRMRDWQGAREAGRIVEFADGRSESVGESRTRVIFELAGLPRPQLQELIIDPVTGGIVGRVDFCFKEERTVGEFDGRLKYRAQPEGGLTAEEVVWREKKREDAIRDLGYEVARSVWAELRRPAVVVDRYRRCFERAAKRRAVLI
jgi:Transcriptional regulator, AbiEi antitoxin